MNCPHCKKPGMIVSKFTPITFGCDSCGNVFSESYIQGYLHGLRDENEQADSADGKSERPLDCVGIDPEKQSTGKHDFRR